MAQTRTKLSSYEVSDKTGFLPENPPLTSLPSYFSKWEEVAGQLSKMLQEKTLRKAVHQLPVLEFSEKTLSSVEEWRRALVVLSALFQGYMWQDGEAGLPSKMPAILCVPFNTVAQKIGVPLVVVYAANSLYNWKLKDSTKPLSIENMRASVTYTGKEDESWFYMVCLLVELEAVPAINAIVDGIAAREKEGIGELTSKLGVIESAIAAMERALRRMLENCDPQFWFSKLLPFFAGTKGLAAFPDGMICEGIDSKPIQNYSFRASQSPSVRAIDLYLGSRHDGMDAKYLEIMQDYMPLKHRQFLEYLSRQPSLRQYVLESGNEALIKQFNATVEALVQFRSYHIIIVTRYVANQIKPSDDAPDKEDPEVTHVVRFLKNTRDNTKALQIPL